MKKAIEPLYEYLDVYNSYEDIMALNAEKYVREMEEDEDNVVSVEELRD